ncbi:hypothetical protein BFF78_19310 [Streptomyces fodineus]|uniref:4'-phosphopantetheinyl transferase domain-containing protein n=1 Tax=Streptomyces fodineus TaxID=1904616 RepID=A0A1D7YBC3_9ACTN|nr:4'-phosphopantetheinyl transferase superfamily protein [Streptomyces fodineus]AOR32925.1 hypothetical protein BFF78_19310 [Streptomyces fodineus]
MAVMDVPLRVVPPPQDWARGVREQLSATGTVLVYGATEDWLPDEHEEDEERLRPLLGRDWHRYRALADQPKTRRRFATSRLLLRQVAAAALETRAELVDLAYQPGGRPYVRGCDQIDVSLSHTEEIIVVGITRRGRIGVDVELADRRMAGTASEKQSCTPYERARLAAVGPFLERNARLVRLWTLKEAYSKALGQGLRLRFTQFGFALPEDGAGPSLVRPDGTRCSAPGWEFRVFDVAGRYVISAAVCDAGFGESADLAVHTMIDEGLLAALLDSGPELG